MAKPIEPTPILRGKDAEDFLKDVAKAEAKHDQKKEKFLEKCEEIYNSTSKEG